MTSLQKEYMTKVEAPFADSLTGLFNHGFFSCALDLEFRRYKRYGTALTLVFLDVDGMGDINNRQGWMTGDKVIKRVGECLGCVLRDADIAARYSEDCFALMLPQTSGAEGASPVERVCSEVESWSQGTVTVSAGIACVQDEDTEVEALINRATNALHQAKLNGRNRCILAESSPRSRPSSLPTVLVVDDEEMNANLMQDMLNTGEFQVQCVHRGQDALTAVSQMDIDLMLLDIVMPGMDGYEVCQRLKNHDRTRQIPVIMITGLEDRQAKIKAIEAGADDFITKPPDSMELLARVRSLIRVKTLNHNLTSIENVLFSFARAVESKDEYTKGHISRVASLGERLGRHLQLPSSELRALRIGGALHDLGKLGIHENILNKTGQLDDCEWHKIQQHPITGAEIAKPLKDTLGASLDIIRHHHEKLDGSGYPDGLKAEYISLPARIMAVVDIYDALVTDRAYRKAFSPEKAVAILEQEAQAGKLDPAVVEAFTVMMQDQRS
ncbi:MAG: diguanylate cyclase [Desulfovermiculus sp.]|nr:diguanylate cyclase [Desulfovermiculus sp.]